MNNSRRASAVNGKTGKERYRIPNLAKACGVIRVLSEAPKGMSLSGIREALSLPHTTALRIVRTLEAEGFLRAEGRSFFLGPELLGVAVRHHAGLDLRAASVPVLRELAERTGETAHFCVLSGLKVLILEVCDSPSPIRAASRPGTLADAHCSATGKALLAWMKPEEADAIAAGGLPRRTASSITSKRALARELKQIRERGYALDDEEYHEGVRCLAAPVMGREGVPVGAVGITAGTERFTRGRIPAVSREVRAAAGKMGRELSGS